MKSRWLSAALVVAGLGVGTAHGQLTPPLMLTPVGAARLPEPYPICEPLPPMMPGPLNTMTAPPGPPECISLPCGHNNASTEPAAPECAFYAAVGAQAWMRQGYGQKVMSVVDPFGLDTGILPPPTAPPFTNLASVRQTMQWGVTATIGYTWGSNQAVELVGSYVFEQNIGKKYVTNGQIDSFFINPPLGFEGNNGLWLQADTQEFQQHSTLASVEANYRYTNVGLLDCDLIIGVRYLNFKDNLDVITDDDGLTFPDAFGRGDPRRAAVLTWQDMNNILVAQVGLEYDRPICGRLWGGFTTKVGFGVDFAQSRQLLSRGDGFFGFDARHNTVVPYTQVYDLGAFLEWHFNDRCILRGGANFMWLVDVYLAQDQIDFNLKNRPGLNDSHGSVYFGGPVIEFRMLF
jgi:hypothetical protein